MKKLVELGKALNKVEQKSINGSGGRTIACGADGPGCPCPCFWDANGQCVQEMVFTRPCD